MSIIDAVAKVQLHHLAGQARKAMAAETVILIVCKANHETKKNEVGCGIAMELAPGADKADGVVAISQIVNDFADMLLRESTGGVLRLVVEDTITGKKWPASPHPGADEVTMDFKDERSG